MAVHFRRADFLVGYNDNARASRLCCVAQGLADWYFGGGIVADNVLDCGLGHDRCADCIGGGCAGDLGSVRGFDRDFLDERDSQSRQVYCGVGNRFRDRGDQDLARLPRGWDFS